MMRSLFDSLRKLNKDKNRQRAVKALCLVLVTVLLFGFWQIGTVAIAMTWTATEDTGVLEEYGYDADLDDSPYADDGTQFDPSGDTSAYSWLHVARSAAPKSAPRKSGRSPRTVPESDVDLAPYITSLNAAGTVKIDETHYMTMLEFDFSIPPQFVYDVYASGHAFVLDLPEDITISQSLINGGPYHAYKTDSVPLELAFTYVFQENPDGTYRVEIRYDQAFAEAALDSGSEFIDNTLHCRCNIEEDDFETHHGIHVDFTDDLELDIPEDNISTNYDVTTHKTGSYTADGKLRYEVTVDSIHGTPSAVDISDTFTYSGDGSVTPPTVVSVIKHNADNTVETFDVPMQGNITSTTPNIYNMELSLPQLHAGESYTLVYEYAVTGLTNDNEAVSAYNSISAHSSDDHDTTSDSTDYFIYKRQRQKIDKDGIPFEDHVQWHISVNERGNDIAGKVVYDSAFANALNETINGTSGIFVQDGSWHEVTLGVDYEYVYGANNEIIGIRFLPADGSTPNTNTYHITYYTDSDVPVAYGDTVLVHNDAEFDGDSVSYDVGITGGGFGKTADGEESLGNDLHGMNWTVTVDIPNGGILSGTTFTDTLSPAGHYLSQTQYNALVSALHTAWGSTPVNVTPIYTDGNITGYTFSVGAAGNGYLMNDGQTHEISWQYQTTGDMSGKVSENFINTFTDGEKTLTIPTNISPNVKKLNVQKINDWTTIFSEEPGTISIDYEDEDKTFVWIAQVTPTPGLQAYRVIDTLPEGVELIGVKVVPTPLTMYNYGMNDYPYNLLTIASDGTISGEIGNLWLSKTIASGQLSTDADGRQVVDVTLTANSASSDLFNNTFYLVYYCQLAEDAWPQNGTVRLGLNNSVRVEANDEDYGQADNEIDVYASKTEKMLDKEGVWDSDSHEITYTLIINPSAQNLLTHSENGLDLDPEWLTLYDVLSYNARQGSGTGEAILALHSVKLEEMVNGVWTEIPNIHWVARTETDADDPDQKNAIIEMQIPDSKKLRLTYKYGIHCDMPDGISLTNVAKLYGDDEVITSTPTPIDAMDFDTYGESTYKEFCLVKIDQKDGLPLSGAVFTVHIWDPQTNTWSATSKSYTTDHEGKIIIRLTDEYDDLTRVYAKDTAYCIIETTPPTGYMLPENPTPFYFWFSGNEVILQNAPLDFMQNAADVSTASYRIEAENLRLDEYIPNTGIFDIRLIPSFVALLVAGVGTCLLAMRIRKKKYYGMEA